MKVKKADRVANLDKVSNVRGSEQSQETIIMIAENPTVQTPDVPSVIVLRYCDRSVKGRGGKIGAGAAYFSPGENVQGLNESIVQDEHNGRRPPCHSAIPEEHLAKVTDIADFGVAKTELPGYQTSVKDDSGDHHGQDKPGS